MCKYGDLDSRPEEARAAAVVVEAPNEHAELFAVAHHDCALRRLALHLLVVRLELHEVLLVAPAVNLEAVESQPTLKAFVDSVLSDAGLAAAATTGGISLNRTDQEIVRQHWQEALASGKGDAS